MDENRYNYYDDDVEIDLIDMMFYMLKKWRGLLVAVVLGAILGLAIYAVKDHQQKAVLEQNAAETELGENETETFDESKYDISDDVEANMELAYQYRQMYRKQLEYNQKSVIMQLDPNAIYTGELKYYLSAGYDTGLVSVLYQSILSDKDLLTELKNASGLDCDVPYMKELISSDISRNNDSSVNINNLLADITDSVASVTKNAFVTYRVVSTSEESCGKMIEVIREKAQQVGEECDANYDNFRVIEVSDAVRKATDNSYLNQQKSNVDQLNTYLTNVQRLENALTDEEKEYYNQKYLAREITEQQEDGVLETETVEAEPVSKVKWLAIGMILLVMIWGVYYVAKYILDKKIKTVSELQHTYHLQVIGRVAAVESNSKGIDKIIDQIYQGIKEQPDTLDYVVQAVNAMKNDKAVLCGNVEIPEVKSVMERLATECKDLEAGEFSSRSAVTLEKAKAFGKEILIVCVGKTRHGEIERELESSRLQKISIAGVVVIE